MHAIPSRTVLMASGSERTAGSDFSIIGSIVKWRLPNWFSMTGLTPPQCEGGLRNDLTNLPGKHHTFWVNRGRITRLSCCVARMCRRQHMQAMCRPIGSETGSHRGQERVFNDVLILYKHMLLSVLLA